MHLVANESCSAAGFPSCTGRAKTRHMRRWIATSVLLISWLASAPGTASQREESLEKLDESDSSLIATGESLEQSARPAEAVQAYRSLVEKFPTSPYERRASARLEWLKARSEGDYAPLTAFLKIRNKRGATRDEIVAFWREVEKFPDGLVKRDSAAFVGEALMNRMNDPAAALPAYESWMRQPGIDDSERQLAISGAAIAKWKTGDLDGARELLRSSGLTERPEWRFLKVQAFRRVAHPIAVASVGLFAALVLAVIALGARRAKWRELLKPGTWLVAVYVIVPPVMAAIRFSNPLKHDYQQLALWLGVTVAAAIVSSVAARGSKLRVPLAASAFFACLAVGVLVAETTEMLEGFTRWYGVSGWH